MTTTRIRTPVRIQTRQEPAGSGWQARLADSPKIWERGNTEAEAVSARRLGDQASLQAMEERRA